MKRLVIGLALLVGFVAPLSADEPAIADYKKPGSYQVETVKLDLKDEKRDRQVPLKVYFPKDAKKPCPVILFSHGLGGSRDGYEYLGQHWASHGYVSVHLQHLGSDDAVWKDSKQPLEDLKKAIANHVNAVNRPLDVKFALDQLTELNMNGKLLKGRLDLERVGMAGHSFGAWTTLAVAGQSFITAGDKEVNWGDPRIKAAIAMSPNAPPNKEHIERSYKNIKVPLFSMTGTNDTSPVDPNTKPEDRLVPFQTIKGPDQFLLVFKDGDHMVFSGRGKRSGGENDAMFQDYVRISSTAFWDAYLKGDGKAKAYMADGAFKKALGEVGTIEYKAGKK